MGGVEAGHAGLGGRPGRRGQLPAEGGLRGADNGELTRWEGGSAAGGIFLRQKENLVVTGKQTRGPPHNRNPSLPHLETAGRAQGCCHLLGDMGTEGWGEGMGREGGKEGKNEQASAQRRC